MKSFNENKLTTFQKREKKYLEKINRSIFIHEMVVTFEKREASFGEWLDEDQKTQFEYERRDRLERIIDHIELFFKISAQYHFDQVICSSDENKENHVTRLIMNENALYTKNSPLNLVEFHRLLEGISLLAKYSPENLHIVISSLAVKQGNELFNYVIYVQGGPEPIITPFSKAHAHRLDPSYKDCRFFKQINDFDLSEYGTTLSTFSLSSNGNISTHPIIKFQTKGGAAGLVVIDICYDFKFSRGKRLFQTILANGKTQMDYIPENISHIVISNTIEVTADKSITKQMIQADPFSKGFKLGATRTLTETPCPINPAYQLDSDIMNVYEELMESKENKYPKIKVNVTSKGFDVKTPPFGHDYKILVYPSYNSKENVSFKYRSGIKNLNNQILENRKRVFCNTFQEEMSYSNNRSN